MLTAWVVAVGGVLVVYGVFWWVIRQSNRVELGP